MKIEDGTRPESLMEAEISEITIDECQAKYDGRLSNAQLTRQGLSRGILESQLCAMNKTHFVDVCAGSNDRRMRINSNFNNNFPI